MGPGSQSHTSPVFAGEAGQAVTGTVTYLGRPLDARSASMSMSIEVVNPSAATGSFKVLGSNDYNSQTGVGNWFDSGIALTALTGAQTHADGVTAATLHGSSVADGVTVAGGPAPVGAAPGTAPLEDPFWRATITSATYNFSAGGVAVGDAISVNGTDGGVYTIAAIVSATQITVMVPSTKSFVGTTGATIQVKSTQTGTLTSATGTFTNVIPGSLVIISAGVDAGTYVVIAVTSSTVLQIQTLQKPSTSYAPDNVPFVGAAGLTYFIPEIQKVEKVNPTFAWYRLMYTNATGAGTLQGAACLKG